MSDFVIPWTELNKYLRDVEERTIGAMAESPTERDLWREQGKLLLVRELLNLKSIMDTTNEPPATVGPRLLTRERWARDHGLSVGRASVAAQEATDGQADRSRT